MSKSTYSSSKMSLSIWSANLSFKIERSAPRVWTGSSSTSSSYNSLNRSSLSFIAFSASFSKIPKFLKQLVNVWFEIASHAFFSMYITERMENFGMGSFFTNAKISLRTASERYLAFKGRMIYWSIGCVWDVVLGGWKTNSTYLRFSTGGWAVEISMIKAIFLLDVANFQSSSCTQSSKSSPDIQLLCWARYRQGKVLTPLKHCDLTDFPMTNFWSVSP